MKKKKWLLTLLMPLLMLFGLNAFSETVQAKELTNVITDVKVWAVSTNAEKTTEADGSYTFYIGSEYKYALNFDLSKYDGNLSDGDYFTFTIPSPVTVKAETFDITEKETGMVVASATVVSNGSSAGGTATITLKNLAEYLQKKGGTQVQGVEGDFYVGFSLQEVSTKQTITFPATETSTPVSHTFEVKKDDASDYSAQIGRSNFDKINGVLDESSWTSAILGKSGSYLHSWRVRVNQKQAAYDTITLHDWVDKDYSPMQFIPETFKVVAGWYNSDYSFMDQTVLTEGTDYTITYNESYTEFTVTINNAKSIEKNGKPAAFRLEYSTTAPADGTQVKNNVEMSGDGQALTISDTNKNTVYGVVNNSRVTSGGSITLKTGYRITLYKVDSKTQDRLKGAKFKITPPAGATAQEEIIETNADGVAQSSIYSEADVKLGEFTITEVEAPAGYELDDTPIKVTVGKDGLVKTIENTKFTTKAQIVATKKLEGRRLTADEFEFTLTDQDGEEVQTVKNDADGNVTFDELTFDAEGTYTYTITEKNGGKTIDGVTYDESEVKVTVTVTDNDKGQLIASVAYDKDDQTFENTYEEPKVPETPGQSGGKKTILPRTGSTTSWMAILSGFAFWRKHKVK